MYCSGDVGLVFVAAYISAIPKGEWVGQYWAECGFDVQAALQSLPSSSTGLMDLLAKGTAGLTFDLRHHGLSLLIPKLIVC